MTGGETRSRTIRRASTIFRRRNRAPREIPNLLKSKTPPGDCRAGLLQDLRDENDADRKRLGGENQNEAGRRLEKFHFNAPSAGPIARAAHLVMRCGRHKIISTRRNFETDNRGCMICNRRVKCVGGTLRCSRTRRFPRALNAVIPAKAGMTRSVERGCRVSALAEYPREDRVDMFEVIAQIELGLDLLGRQRGAHLGIGLEQLEQ